MALVAGGQVPSARRPREQRPAFVPYSSRARAFGGMFAIHFLLAGALAFGAVVAPSAAWAYGALALFASMCFGLLRTSPATFLLFVPLLALRITEFMSGGAIESGAYMIETMITGTATGAFTRLLLIYLLFFLTATFVVEASWPRLKVLFREAPARWEPQGRLIAMALMVVMTFGSLYLIRLGINNGFPLISHIDRFQYLERVDSPIYSAWMSNRLVMVPFMGVLFAVPRYRLQGGLLLVWLLATSILFGEKFTSLLMILSIFSIPAGLAHIANDRPIPTGIIGGVALAVVVVTVPAVLIAYGALNDFDGAAKRYGERVALQGQLWYVADWKYLAAARLDDRAIASDMASWVKPGEQDATKAGTRFGLYYVMQPFTPSRTMGWTMEAGGGFVFSLYPYFLMAMGIIGLLVMSSIIAIFHAWIMRMLAQCLAQANWIASVLFGRVLSSIYAGYSTGYMWNFFGIKSLLTIAVALFLTWEGQRRNSRVRQMTQALARRR
ncbi:hypothetical protein FHS97_002200 [Sphingomonas endophytica]|uniref:DUF6418 domain-containing protein n=1 Tax=Sphingomonas endophytica TaxID=869719 RepID=A0ABR6N6W2_9SPHN|nr:DUF6418 domain-containing protein [Sphingomonas endophytica]MBB5726264.1 hypothetical protein [Sphingomonas endophytica]